MRRSLHYLKAAVICHGKSEYQMCNFINSNLNGFKSNKTLSIKYGDDFPNGKIPDDFKIFLIMDLDDCTEQEKRNFLNKLINQIFPMIKPRVKWNSILEFFPQIKNI